MRFWLSSLPLLLACWGSISPLTGVQAQIALRFPPENSDTESSKTVNEAVESLKQNFNTLARQLITQQLYVEEQTRASGGSGLKAIRGQNFGTRPYFGDSFVGNSLASIHNHANNIRTVGLGEFVAVLNGVEFRTRHNDYGLRMKCSNCTEYGVTEDIPFPGVPPEVTQRSSLDDQSAEMREWFKAWRDQDYSVRDYRDYFKPVLCYLEGAWTFSDASSLEESFESDRHFLDASSWQDLQDKVRFTSYTGSKSTLENFAYLPTTIMTIVNDTVPVLAQWNYKILCHPLSFDVPLKWLRVVDDVKTRMRYGMPYSDLKSSRTARFQVNYARSNSEPWQEQGGKWGILDDMMLEIPGMDNYDSELRDDFLGLEAQPYQRPSFKGEALNAGRYHRRYKVSKKGAMGLSSRSRGFNDENIFMAMTTQAKIAGMSIKECRRANRPSTCAINHQKWSYAIPLELIYLTPLNAWNPLDLEYKGDARADYGKTVYEGPLGMRNGRADPDYAFNGTNSKVYYRTPAAFFDKEFDYDPADTTKDGTNVLSRTGSMHYVKATGTRIFLPNIPDVGVLRQRFPIMPVHDESNPVWQELEALKDIMLEPERYRHMRREQPAEEEEPPTPPKGPGETVEEEEEELKEEGEGIFVESYFQLQASSALYGSHTHDVVISADNMKTLYEGGTVSVTSEEAEGHSHEMEVRALERNNGKRHVFQVLFCDGVRRGCWDGHPFKLEKMRD